MRKQIALLAAAAIAVNASAPVCFAKTITPNAAEAASSKTTSAADTEDRSDMEKALATVKSRITIPEEYSKFSCTTGESNGLKNYNFTWENPDDISGSSYYVTVTGDLITSYTSPDRYNYGQKRGFAKMSKKAFANKALSWLYTVNPSMKGYTEADDDIRLRLDSDIVSISFSRKYGSVEVRNNSGRIYLNKYTGDVLGMDMNWWQNAKFGSSADVLTQEAIKEIYAKEVTIKPWYRISTDYETNKTTASIVYEPQNSFIYNASTGEHSTMNDDYLAALDTDKYSDSGYDMPAEEEALDVMEEDDIEATPATGIKFTDEEKKKLADMSKMLTSDNERQVHRRHQEPPCQ